VLFQAFNVARKQRIYRKCCYKFYRSEGLLRIDAPPPHSKDISFGPGDVFFYHSTQTAAIQIWTWATEQLAWISVIPEETIRVIQGEKYILYLDRSSVPRWVTVASRVRMNGRTKQVNCQNA
jgi:hypothetical protein